MFRLKMTPKKYYFALALICCPTGYYYYKTRNANDLFYPKSVKIPLARALLLKNKNEREAELNYLEALNRCSDAKIPQNSSLYTGLLIEIGDFYLNNKDFKSSFSMFKKALDLEVDSLKRAGLAMKLGDVCAEEEEGSFARAEEYYNMCMDILLISKDYTRFSEELGSCMQRISDLYVKMGKISLAHQTNLSMLNLFLISGQNCKAAMVCNQLADFCMDDENLLDDAEKYISLGLKNVNQGISKRKFWKDNYENEYPFCEECQNALFYNMGVIYEV
jgi:tetratricopeptide (TPR) repeat protein